jgi:hypothetical protein
MIYMTRFNRSQPSLQKRALCASVKARNKTTDVRFGADEPRRRRRFRVSALFVVMAGLVPAIHASTRSVLFSLRRLNRVLGTRPWMAGTSPAMTIESGESTAARYRNQSTEHLCVKSGHDDLVVV